MSIGLVDVFKFLSCVYVVFVGYAAFGVYDVIAKELKIAFLRKMRKCGVPDV